MVVTRQQFLKNVNIIKMYVYVGYQKMGNN